MIGPSNVAKLQCDDVALFSELYSGWDHEALQFSSGKFGYRETAIMLPGLRIFWIRHGSAMRMRESYTADMTCMYIPLAGEAHIRWKGEDLDKRSLLIQRPGEDHDFSTGGPCKALYLQMDPPISQFLAPSSSSNSIVRPLSRDIDWFVSLCRKVSELAQRPGVSPHDLLAARDNLLREVDALLDRANVFPEKTSSINGHRNSHYSIYRRGLDFVRYTRDRVSIRSIASGLEVSERSLHRAFVNWVGVGPSRYFEVQRLHDIRRHILYVDRGSTRISELAERFGFTNSGRMARRYGDLFRESPGETARRARLERK